MYGLSPLSWFPQGLLASLVLAPLHGEELSIATAYTQIETLEGTRSLLFILENTSTFKVLYMLYFFFFLMVLPSVLKCCCEFYKLISKV